MTPDMLFVFATLGITIALFVSDRIRMDLVALMVVVALAVVRHHYPPPRRWPAFGEPVVIMIAALFVVGEALFRTGIAAAAGNWLLRMGGSSETRLLLFLLPVVALLSAFMSSTGAVALLIPVVLSMGAPLRHAALTIADAAGLCRPHWWHADADRYTAQYYRQQPDAQCRP